MPLFATLVTSFNGICLFVCLFVYWFTVRIIRMVAVGISDRFRRLNIISLPTISFIIHYNTSFVYCRELAPGTVSLTGGWARGDDSKQYRYIGVVSKVDCFYLPVLYSLILHCIMSNW